MVKLKDLKKLAISEMINIDSRLLDARLIICHFLNINTTDYFIKDDMSISSLSYQQVINACKKRNNDYPLSYITNSKEFYGNDFYIKEGVLDPRTDTEFLIQNAIDVIESNNINSILEIGTGSGVICITLKKLYNNIDVTGVDISDIAIEVTNKNIIKHNVNIDIIKGNVFENVRDKYDIIISNPPYIPSGVLSTLKVKKHEPTLALDGDEDGYKIIKEIITNSVDYLKPNGHLIMEIDYLHKDSIKSLFEKIGGYKNICVNNVDSIKYTSVIAQLK